MARENEREKEKENNRALHLSERYSFSPQLNHHLKLTDEGRTVSYDSDLGVGFVGTPMNVLMRRYRFHLLLNFSDGCMSVGISTLAERKHLHLQYSNYQVGWRLNSGTLQQCSSTLAHMKHWSKKVFQQSVITFEYTPINKNDLSDTTNLQHLGNIQVYFNGKAIFKDVIPHRVKNGTHLYGKPNDPTQSCNVWFHFGVYLSSSNAVSLVDYRFLDEPTSLQDFVKQYLLEQNIDVTASTCSDHSSSNVTSLKWRTTHQQTKEYSNNTTTEN